ncbi:MAG: DUF2683 family protein [Candidatus Micrarchaeia archaeon]|jgi:myosin-crossreactive antigen
MVKAFVNIDKNTNWILNIIKAKYDLKDKSEAIEVMARKYKEEILEPELKPEYLAELKKKLKGKRIKVNNLDDVFA